MSKLLDKPTPSLEAVAKKHNVSLEVAKTALSAGIKVEMEHTNDPKVAREIALDHLNEKIDYYKKLKKVEEMRNIFENQGEHDGKHYSVSYDRMGNATIKHKSSGKDVYVQGDESSELAKHIHRAQQKKVPTSMIDHHLSNYFNEEVVKDEAEASLISETSKLISNKFHKPLPLEEGRMVKKEVVLKKNADGDMVKKIRYSGSGHNVKRHKKGVKKVIGESLEEAKMDSATAKNILHSVGADKSTNFFSLRQSQVSDLLGHAKKHKYRASKNAPGSTGRMFFQHVQRKAMKEETENLSEMSRAISDRATEAFLNKKSHKEKNTHTDGSSLHLHGNKIAWHGDNGKIHATLAGWNTKTTKERLNSLSSRVGGGQFTTKKGVAHYNGKPIGDHDVVTIKEETVNEISTNSLNDYVTRAKEDRSMAKTRLDNAKIRGDQHTADLADKSIENRNFGLDIAKRQLKLRQLKQNDDKRTNAE